MEDNALDISEHLMPHKKGILAVKRPTLKFENYEIIM